MQGLNIDAFNSDVKTWGKSALVLHKAALARSKHSGSLRRGLRVRFPKRFGAVRSVRFQFPRHGIYIEKGASRGYGGKKGSRWVGPNGPRRTNPSSLGKADAGNRPAKPWYNPVIDRKIGALGNVVAVHFANAAVNVIRIK